MHRIDSGILCAHSVEYENWLNSNSTQAIEQIEEEQKNRAGKRVKTMFKKPQFISTNENSEIKLIPSTGRNDREKRRGKNGKTTQEIIIL